MHHVSIYITRCIIILLCIFYGQFCLLLYVSHFIRRFSSLVENWASHRCRFDAGQDSVLWPSTKIWRNENNRNILYRSTRKHNVLSSSPANASAFYPARDNITLTHLLSRSHHVLSIDCARNSRRTVTLLNGNHLFRKTVRPSIVVFDNFPCSLNPPRSFRLDRHPDARLMKWF